MNNGTAISALDQYYYDVSAERSIAGEAPSTRAATSRLTQSVRRHYAQVRLAGPTMLELRPEGA